MQAMQQFFLGVGLSQNQDKVGVACYIATLMRDHGIAAIDGIATIKSRIDHPLMTHLAYIFAADIVAFSVCQLEAQTPRLANPSPRLYSRIGCHGVAEAAALARAGIRAQLVIEKTCYQAMSFAIAQRNE